MKLMGGFSVAGDFGNGHQRCIGKLSLTRINEQLRTGHLGAIGERDHWNFSNSHALRAAALPLHHRRSFLTEMLIAQAQLEPDACSADATFRQCNNFSIPFVVRGRFQKLQQSRLKGGFGSHALTNLQIRDRFQRHNTACHRKACRLIVLGGKADRAPLIAVEGASDELLLLKLWSWYMGWWSTAFSSARFFQST